MIDSILDFRFDRALETKLALLDLAACESDSSVLNSSYMSSLPMLERLELSEFIAFLISCSGSVLIISY